MLSCSGSFDGSTSTVVGLGDGLGVLCSVCAGVLSAAQAVNSVTSARSSRKASDFFIPFHLFFEPLIRIADEKGLP